MENVYREPTEEERKIVSFYHKIHDEFMEANVEDVLVTCYVCGLRDILRTISKSLREDSFIRLMAVLANGIVECQDKTPEKPIKKTVKKKVKA